MIHRIEVSFESADANNKPLGPDVRHAYRIYVSPSAQIPTLVFVSIFPITAAPMPELPHYPIPADTPLTQIGGDVAMRLQALPGNEQLHLNPPQFSVVENEELQHVIAGIREVLLGMNSARQ